MPIDQAFLKAVRPLHSKAMGTELVSEVIYSLVRSTRPRRLLEVGAGYTTPFILQALRDNEEDIGREVEEIRRIVAQTGKPIGPKHNYVREFYGKNLAKRPILYSIDDLSYRDVKALGVGQVARKLKLGSYLKSLRGDFRKLRPRLGRNSEKFDFVWFDCGSYSEYVDFLDQYWSLLNPDGGLLLLHSTLTNIAIREVLGKLKLRQSTTGFNDFELVSILEPHKAFQNSFTLIRITSGYVDRTYTFGP